MPMKGQQWGYWEPGRQKDPVRKIRYMKESQQLLCSKFISTTSTFNLHCLNKQYLVHVVGSN